MFKRFFQPTCIRPGCGHKNPEGAEFCDKCGISLAFNRPAILDGNRWSPAPDEVAVSFRTRELKGLFTKNLHVPPGMRAWLLQGDTVQTLAEGEHTTDTLFQLMNNFFRAQPGEVLIARSDAFELNFSYTDLPSRELLDIQGQITLQVRLADIQAARSRLMQRQGAATVGEYEELLKGSVRQVLVEYLAARSIKDLAADGELRKHLEQALVIGLAKPLANQGLRLEAITELALHHDALNEQRQLRARLWLLRQEAELKAEHDKAVDEVYSAAQWHAIQNRAAGIDRDRAHADLTAKEAEVAQVLRGIKLKELKQVLEAETEEAAARLGAAEQVAELRSKFAGKQRDRDHLAQGAEHNRVLQALEWRHLQEQARLAYNSESKLFEMRNSHQQRLLEAEQHNALERFRVQAELDLARLVHDEGERLARERQQLELLAKNRVREGMLADARLKADLEDIDLAQANKRWEADRARKLADVQFEEARAIVAAQRKRDEAQWEAQRKRDDQQTGLDALGKMIVMDEQIEDGKLNRKLREAREAHDRAEKEAQSTHQREMDKLRDARETARLAGEQKLQEMNILGQLPAEAIITLATNPAQIAAITEVAITRIRVDMTPEQIKASQAPAAATYAPAAPVMASAPGPSVEDRVSAAIKEAHARSEADKDRLERVMEKALGAISEAGRNTKEVAIGQAQALAGHASAGVAASGHPAPATTVVVNTGAPAPAQPATSSAYLKVSTSSCTRCGTTNLASAKLCGECGAPV